MIGRALAIGRSIGRARGMMRKVAEQSTAIILVQGLGAITTLSFVHLLTVRDYALFGLCILTANFISIVSDLGLMASMGYFWREALRGGVAFAGRYLVIRRLRRVLFAVSGTIGLSVLAVLITQQGRDRETIVVSVAIVAVLSWVQINGSMNLLLLRLGDRLRSAYLSELAGSVTRALLAALAFALAWRTFWFPLLAMLGTSWMTARLARSKVDDPMAGAAHANAEVRPVLAYVLRTMPGTLLFATQEFIVYGLASWRGGSVVVAQAFALGRLSAIFVVLSGVFLNVIIPRVVNVSDDRHALRNGMIPVALIALLCSGIIAFAALFPNLMLYVLGAKYRDLQIELLLSLTMASLQLVAQSLSQFNRSLGWIRLETPVCLFHAVMLVALVPFFPFDTARATLTCGCIMASLSVLESLFVTTMGLRASNNLRNTAESA